MPTFNRQVSLPLFASGRGICSTIESGMRSRKGLLADWTSELREPWKTSFRVKSKSAMQGPGKLRHRFKQYGPAINMCDTEGIGGSEATIAIQFQQPAFRPD